MLVERGLRIEFVFRKFGLFLTISIQMEPAYKRVNHGENAIVSVKFAGMM
nr:hypothetical protein [Brevibacillus laterosporus]